MLHVPKESFIKILVDQNYVHMNLIKALQKENYQILLFQESSQIESFIHNFHISLIVVHLNQINENLKDYPLIILINLNQINELEKIVKQYNCIDYFLCPIESLFFINRINFYFSFYKKKENFLEKSLKNFLWKSKIYNEEKLHFFIWENKFNNYLLSKLIQFITYFSHIIRILDDVFYQNNLYFVTFLKKHINLICLQMCFFNCFILINIEKEDYPNFVTIHNQYFFLFLIFVGEICKQKLFNITIFLNFSLKEDGYGVKITFPKTFYFIISIYNNLLNDNSLLYFLQSYLWQFWRKKISILSENESEFVIEFLLETKIN